MRVCLCMKSIAKWLRYWTGNQTVPSLIPSKATLVLFFPWAKKQKKKNFAHTAPVYPALL